jgi:hypothetical protein
MIRADKAPNRDVQVEILGRDNPPPLGERKAKRCDADDQRRVPSAGPTAKFLSVCSRGAQGAISPGIVGTSARSRSRLVGFVVRRDRGGGGHRNDKRAAES